MFGKSESIVCMVSFKTEVCWDSKLDSAMLTEGIRPVRTDESWYFPPSKCHTGVFFDDH